MDNKFPESIFQQFFNRASTENDRRFLLAMKANARLGDDDELWSLILAIHWYYCKNAKSASTIERNVELIVEKLDAYVAKVPSITLAAAESAVSEAVLLAAVDIKKTIQHETQRRAKEIWSWRPMVAGFGITVSAVLIGILIHSATSYSCIDEPVRTGQGRLACFVSEPSFFTNIIELWSFANYQQLHASKVL